MTRRERAARSTFEAVRLARLIALFFAARFLFQGDWLGVLIMLASVPLLGFFLPSRR